MATTKEDIATRAFKRIGANAVTDFTDVTQTEAAIAALLYEEIVEATLGGYPWTFAKQMEQMSLDGTAPLTKYTSAYRIPTKCLLLRAVYVQGNPINFETYGNMIYCDATADDTVIAEFIARVDESVWPPHFAHAVAYELAGVFAGAIARDAALIQSMEERAIFQLRKARSLDAQSETTQRIKSRRLIDNRN